MKTLYNLTYEGVQYISTVEPDRLPEDDYSFVEITYDENLVISVKGIYYFNGKKDDMILSDLEIFHHFNKIKKFDNDLKFIGAPEPEDKNNKIFILFVCSYLIYFSFMKIPFELSLDLLDNNAFSYVSSFKPNNSLETAWISQVNFLHKNFSYLFPSIFSFENIEIFDISNENMEEIEKDVFIEKYVKKIAKKYVKDYAKGYIKEYISKKTLEIDKASKLAIEKINQEAFEISKEAKEFKRRLLLDIK